MQSTKRALLVVLILAAAVMALTGEALAAGAWYTCTVEQAGPNGTIAYPSTTPAASTSRIFLTDTASSPAWVGSKEFSISATRAREFLAVGLAAITSGKKVKVFFTFPANLTAIPTLTAIYLEAN